MIYSRLEKREDLLSHHKVTSRINFGTFAAYLIKSLSIYTQGFFAYHTAVSESCLAG